MLRKWHGNPWAILAILSLGFFMTLLDLTIVNIAIPDMVNDLDATLDEILWVVNAYTLALATLIITAGRFGDLRGKSNLYTAGVTLFTLASLACGLAQDPIQLIAFRAVQGVGAAMLIPQTLSIIADVFPDEKRGTALGIWGAIAGVSGVAGPTLGGLLVTHLDWRWIFFINIPIGVVVILAAIPIMPRAERVVKHRYDMPGVLMVSAALFFLAFALIEGERYEWNAWIWSMIGAAVVLLGAFLAYERGQQDNEPLLPFSLFRNRNFALVNFVGVAMMFGVIGLFLPVTIYLQSVLGFSALKAGGVLVPLALGTMITAGPAGVLAEKVGGKYILTTGLLTFGTGMVWFLSVAETGSGWGVFVAPLLLSGLGAGCTFAPMGSEVMRGVPAHLTGAASGVNNALRQVGSVLGGAAIGAILQAQLTSSLRDEAERGAAALPPGYRPGFVEGFADAGSRGLDVGADQATAMPVPANVPVEVARTFQRLAAQVFGNGFVDALKPTMLVSALVIFTGAVACLALKSHAGRPAAPHGLPGSTPAGEPEPAGPRSAR